MLSEGGSTMPPRTLNENARTQSAREKRTTLLFFMGSSSEEIVAGARARCLGAVSGTGEGRGILDRKHRPQVGVRVSFLRAGDSVEDRDRQAHVRPRRSEHPPV